MSLKKFPLNHTITLTVAATLCQAVGRNNTRKFANKMFTYYSQPTPTYSMDAEGEPYGWWLSVFRAFQVLPVQ